MKPLLALLIVLVLAGCGRQQHAPRFPLYGAPIGYDSAALAERAQHQTEDAAR
jgi:hypothetical protein